MAGKGRRYSAEFKAKAALEALYGELMAVEHGEPSPVLWTGEDAGARHCACRRAAAGDAGRDDGSSRPGRHDPHQRAGASHGRRTGSACHGGGGAGLADLHFHDLRGTAVTRLALAGCTMPQVAAITGRSQKDAEAILQAHFLGGSRALAEQAIENLEGRRGK